MIDDDLNSTNMADADVDAIYAQAAEWIVRLRAVDVTAEDIASWQRWIQLDARHGTAFERLEEVGSQIAQLGSSRARPSPPTRRALARDSYDGSIPIRLWSKSRPLESRRLGLLVWGRGLIAVLSFGLVLSFAWRLHESTFSTVYRTRIGQNRNVRLRDGSRITLGGDSQIAVDFDPRMRRVALLHGEAFFSVAKNPQRPFELTVGHAVLVDVGTSFDVRRAARRTVISVLEGRVAVRTRATRTEASARINPAGSASVVLGANESTIVDADRIEPVSRISDPAAVTAWMSGQLAFRWQPLGQVLEQVNRYSTKPIVAANPKVANLEITGTVVEQSVPEWIASLRTAIGIEADEQPNRIVLRQVSD